MQHTTGVAVLATHLADTDRRALSQAWYSALHLAGRTPARRATAQPPLAPASSDLRTPRPARAALQSCAPRDTAGTARRTTARATRPNADDCQTERRSARTVLARRIERALARRAPLTGTASFAVRAAGGRIHLVVRSDGDRTRVVAVCAPPLRERVERALAHARFALAGRGIRSEAA